MFSWEDVECSEAINTPAREHKCTLTLRSSKLFRYRYTPPDGQTLKEAAMHMEMHCVSHPLSNKKIRGPIKVLDNVFVDAINIRATRYIRHLKFTTKTK